MNQAGTCPERLLWTLSRAHSRGRGNVVKALRALSSNATVALESTAAVWEATHAFEHGRADFADCLLVHQGRVGGL